MDGRYLSISECITLLRSANIPTKDKLRLEADFIQIKVSLLKDADSTPPRAHEYDERYFSQLVAQIRCLAENGASSNDFLKLSSELKPVIYALSQAASESY